MTSNLAHVARVKPIAELEAIIQIDDRAERIAAAAEWGKRWLLQTNSTIVRSPSESNLEWQVHIGSALHQLAEAIIPECAMRADAQTVIGPTVSVLIVALRREPYVAGK